MLLPKYSLRTVLFGITGCAIYFLILGEALRGQEWAIGISAGVGSILIGLIFHGLLYVVVSFISNWVGTQELPARTSQGGLQTNPDQQVAVSQDEARSA